MIHKLSDVKSKKIGENTSVWQYTVILEDAVVGDNCNICSNVFIENDVKIGHLVTVKNGAKLFDGLKIHDNVFVGPNVVFTNDKYPRSKKHLTNQKTTIVMKGSSIGAGSIILTGVKIGEFSMIGAGSIVTKDVEPYSIVAGNPAKKIGLIDKLGEVKWKQKNFHI